MASWPLAAALASKPASTATHDNWYFDEFMIARRLVDLNALIAQHRSDEFQRLLGRASELVHPLMHVAVEYRANVVSKLLAAFNEICIHNSPRKCLTVNCCH